MSFQSAVAVRCPKMFVTNIIREVHAVLPKEGKLGAVHLQPEQDLASLPVWFQAYPHHHRLGQRATRPIGRISEEWKVFRLALAETLLNTAGLLRRRN